MRLSVRLTRRTAVSGGLLFWLLLGGPVIELWVLLQLCHAVAWMTRAGVRWVSSRGRGVLTARQAP